MLVENTCSTSASGYQDIFKDSSFVQRYEPCHSSLKGSKPFLVKLWCFPLSSLLEPVKFTHSSSTGVKFKFLFRHSLLTTGLILRGPFDMCLFEKVSQWTGAFLIFDKFYLTQGNGVESTFTRQPCGMRSNGRNVTWISAHRPSNNKT